ncbi:MAG: hypothetical protein OXG82_15460 [Gammaproteobacteria bacterium]|nr:hypothetical protein [Gammaproteobacteria bacterium]
MVKLGIAVAIGFLAGAVAVMSLVSYRADDLGLANVLAGPVDQLAGQRAEAKVRASAPTLATIMRMPSDFEQTAMLYQLLRDTDAATIERLLAEADELRPAREGFAAKSIIVARYAELDPRAAVQAVMADGGDPVLVRSVFAAWGKMDHEAALDSARDLPELTGRHAAMAVLTVADALSDGQRRSAARAFSVLPAFEREQARAAARQDPAAAWNDALATHGGQAQGDGAQVLWEIAHRWADTDPQEALAAVLALPSSTRRRTWLDTLAGRWAHNDLDAATTWALAQSWSAERTRMLASIARVIAADSPREAVAFAGTLTGEARRSALGSVLDTWAEQDPRAALAALDELDELGDRAAKGLWRLQLTHGWARQDPRAAAYWVVTQPPTADRARMLDEPLRRLAATAPRDAILLANRLRGRERREALSTVLRAWAGRDVRGAANWVATSRSLDASQRDQQLGVVLQTWARDDTLAAVAWVEANGSSPGAVATVARHYANRDPREALDWVLSQPRRVQRRAISAVAQAWARDAPREAARAVARIRADDIRTSGQDAVASAWGEADPDQALRWVAGLPDAEQRERLSTHVLTRWTQFDAKGAVAHVRRMRNVDERDAMALTLIMTLLHLDTDLAEELYGTLTHPELRENAAARLYRYWQDRDPGRARRCR